MVKTTGIVIAKTINAPGILSEWQSGQMSDIEL